MNDSPKNKLPATATELSENDLDQVTGGAARTANPDEGGEANPDEGGEFIPTAPKRR